MTNLTSDSYIHVVSCLLLLPFFLFQVLGMPMHTHGLSILCLPLTVLMWLKNTSLSTPAQLQCSYSGVWEPGNEATSSLPSSPPFWKLSLTFSVHLFMTSEVKCGSCLRKESRLHMAWVTIWANSMAVRAGESQLLLLRTSTQAWIRRMAWKEMKQYNVGVSRYNNNNNNNNNKQWIIIVHLWDCLVNLIGNLRILNTILRLSKLQDFITKKELEL